MNILNALNYMVLNSLVFQSIVQVETLGVLWCSQDLNLSLLPLVFSLILTVASRLLHLYSIDDKTSRLMMFLHSEGHMERYTELHGEEKRENGDRGDQEEKRGNQKGGEKLASNHFPMCSPQSGPLRDVHRITQRREEGGRRERWPGG